MVVSRPVPDPPSGRDHGRRRSAGPSVRPGATAGRIGPAGLLLVGLVAVAAGCQTFGGRPMTGDELDDAVAAAERDGDVRQVGYEEDQLDEAAEEPTFWEKWSPSSVFKSVEKLTERPVLPGQAKEAYAKAEALFKTAHPQTNRDAYLEAAKLYASAAKSWPDSAMEQDSLFMVAECYYFAQHFVDADTAYGELIKSYPNTRHMDVVASRRFKIAKYWIEAEQATSFSLGINFFDERYPWRDNTGSAVATYEKIRIDDVTGVLADDATMAAGNARFKQGDYYSASDFYEEVIEQFPGSPHVFDAMFLAVKAKLLSYRGPAYDATCLDEADKLVVEMKRRFPRQADERREFVTRAAAEIHYRKAELEYTMARYYERRTGYGGARYHYQRLAENYADTPFAGQAKTRVAAIADQPDKPVRRMAWLEDYLPKDDPFQGIEPIDGSGVKPGGSVLR